MSLDGVVMERTVFTFDQPDQRVITIDRLVPFPRRDDVIQVDDEVRGVRSATLVVNSTTGSAWLYVRLRGGANDGD